jgi:hypothetical protein
MQGDDVKRVMGPIPTAGPGLVAYLRSPPLPYNSAVGLRSR